jgi:tetratricopeptide (TPR) repeat protein
VADERDLDNTVPFPVPRVAERSMDLSGVRAYVQQLNRERREAVGIVARLLSETRRKDLPTLAEHPELQTYAAVERLVATVSTELTRDPRYALKLAHLAVSVADRLRTGPYRKSMRAQALGIAWQAVGKTLSFLGRYEKAVDTFEWAEVDAGPHASLYQVATIRLDLASTYQEMGKYDKARAILVECQEVFRLHGATEMVVLAGIQEGQLLQRQSRYREAREVYLLLLTSNPRIETEQLAALHNAIGLCSIELGDDVPADSHLTASVHLHKELGQPLDAARAEQALGRLLIRRGWYRDGVSHLRSARLQFLKHPLAEDAGICGLDMVEGLLLADESGTAYRLVLTITNEFLAARLSERAVTALRYLCEAINTLEATPEMAVEIREYVLSLRNTPERELPSLPQS